MIVMTVCHLHCCVLCSALLVWLATAFVMLHWRYCCSETYWFTSPFAQHQTNCMSNGRKVYTVCIKQLTSSAYLKMYSLLLIIQLYFSVSDIVRLCEHENSLAVSAVFFLLPEYEQYTTWPMRTPEIIKQQNKHKLVACNLLSYMFMHRTVAYVTDHAW